MKMGKLSLLVVLSAIAAISVIAMEETDFSALKKEEYEEFRKIKSKIIAPDFCKISEMSTTFGNDSNQSDRVLYHVITTFSKDKEASPEELVQFINNRKKDTDHAACDVSVNTLSSEQLLSLVESNIAIDTPVLVYYVLSGTINLGALVGIKGDELIMVSSLCSGEPKLAKISAGAFLSHMDTRKYKSFNLISFMRDGEQEEGAELEGIAAVVSLGVGWACFFVYLLLLPNE